MIDAIVTHLVWSAAYFILMLPGTVYSWLGWVALVLAWRWPMR